MHMWNIEIGKIKHPKKIQSNYTYNIFTHTNICVVIIVLKGKNAHKGHFCSFETQIFRLNITCTYIRRTSKQETLNTQTS